MCRAASYIGFIYKRSWENIWIFKLWNGYLKMPHISSTFPPSRFCLNLLAKIRYFYFHTHNCNRCGTKYVTLATFARTFRKIYGKLSGEMAGWKRVMFLSFPPIAHEVRPHFLPWFLQIFYVFSDHNYLLSLQSADKWP